MMINTHFRTLFRTKTGVTCFLLTPLMYVACSVDPENRPSPLVKEKGKVDEVVIELSYSSPSVRERKIFGNGEDYLEQYGELWRTGANKASTIYFHQDILVDYLQIDSGIYSIFTIPERKKWTFILNSEWNQWGSYDYSETHDVLRLEVPSSKMVEKQEKMRLFIAEDSLKFRWNHTKWAIPLTSPPSY